VNLEIPRDHQGKPSSQTEGTLSVPASPTPTVPFSSSSSVLAPPITLSRSHSKEIAGGYETVPDSPSSPQFSRRATSIPPRHADDSLGMRPEGVQNDSNRDGDDVRDEAEMQTERHG
jgi:hypothetical protein